MFEKPAIIEYKASSKMCKNSRITIFDERVTNDFNFAFVVLEWKWKFIENLWFMNNKRFIRDKNN